MDVDHSARYTTELVKHLHFGVVDGAKYVSGFLWAAWITFWLRRQLASAFPGSPVAALDSADTWTRFASTLFVSFFVFLVVWVIVWAGNRSKRETRIMTTKMQMPAFVVSTLLLMFNLSWATLVAGPAVEWLVTVRYGNEFPETDPGGFGQLFGAQVIISLIVMLLALAGSAAAYYFGYAKTENGQDGFKQRVKWTDYLKWAARSANDSGFNFVYGFVWGNFLSFTVLGWSATVLIVRSSTAGDVWPVTSRLLFARFEACVYVTIVLMLVRYVIPTANESFADSDAFMSFKLQQFLEAMDSYANDRVGQAEYLLEHSENVEVLLAAKKVMNGAANPGLDADIDRLFDFYREHFEDRATLLNQQLRHAHEKKSNLLDRSHWRRRRRERVLTMVRFGFSFAASFMAAMWFTYGVITAIERRVTGLPRDVGCGAVRIPDIFPVEYVGETLVGAGLALTALLLFFVLFSMRRSPYNPPSIPGDMVPPRHGYDVINYMFVFSSAFSFAHWVVFHFITSITRDWWHVTLNCGAVEHTAHRLWITIVMNLTLLALYLPVFWFINAYSNKIAVAIAKFFRTVTSKEITNPEYLKRITEKPKKLNVTSNDIDYTQWNPPRKPYVRTGTRRLGDPIPSDETAPENKQPLIVASVGTGASP